MSDITILTKEDAAELLLMSAATLIRKAKAGKIPGRKTGKQWIFVKEHLIEWLKGDYANHSQSSQVVDRTSGNNQLCQSRKEEKRGGSTSQHQAVSEYESLLGLK